MKNISATEIRDEVSLVDLLTRLGYEPKRHSGKELLYVSMLRDSDTSPSFCVNGELNVWFDHGTGKGGNIIDFGLAYWPRLTFPEVLQKIAEVCAADKIACEPLRSRVEKPRLAVKLPNYKIEHIGELPFDGPIASYLKARGIFEEGKECLREIFYYVEDEKKVRKHFQAAGWQNENGGWEVRTKHFKGCLGRKGLTIIERDENKLSVFEGFMDYLSWKKDNPEEKDSTIILNGVGFLDAAIKRARNYELINLYFDLDKAGRAANKAFTEAHSNAIDRSSAYIGYHDYNEKHIAEEKQKQQLLQEPPGFFERIKVPFRR